MITQPYKIYVERFDPTCNMARFYALSISETLFGDNLGHRGVGQDCNAGANDDPSLRA
jgi:Uncharacterized conserved protein